MKVTSIKGRLTNYIKRSRISRTNRKDISELCADISKNFGYDNVKVKAIDKNNVKIIGTKSNSNNNIIVDLDLKNRTQTQTEHTNYLALVIDGLFPHREMTQTIKGDMDGSVKYARTITKASNNNGSYRESNEYQNFVSGNIYKREKYVDKDGKCTQVKFFKNIDGDFVELFGNK